MSKSAFIYHSFAPVIAQSLLPNTSIPTVDSPQTGSLLLRSSFDKTTMSGYSILTFGGIIESRIGKRNPVHFVAPASCWQS